MNYLNFSINKFNKYQYTILIIFLVIISIILNIKTNKNIKIILLVLSLVICFFHPSLLIPYGSSLYVLYLINRQRRKNKKKNIKERFENSVNYKDYFDLVNYLNNPSKKIFNNKIFINIQNNNDFLKFLDNNQISNINFVKKKYNFIIDLGKCYFFDLENKEDYKLVFKLSEKYDQVNNLYKDLEFTNIFENEDTNVDKKRDRQIKLLKNKPLKKLGLFFYKSKFRDVNYLNKSIFNLGFYSIVNNLFEIRNIDKANYTSNYLEEVLDENKLEKQEYDKLKKIIYELVLLILYDQNKTIETLNKGTSNESKIEYFDFNKKLVLDKNINIFKTFTKNYLTQIRSNTIANNNYVNINKKLIFINKFILKKNRVVNKKNNNKISSEKIDFSKSNRLFPKINKYNFVPIRNDKDLEQNLDLMIDDVINNYQKLDLLSISYYNTSDRKEKKKQEFIIHNNLSLFFCLMNKEINKLLEDINKNTELKEIFNKLYKKKSKLFKTQLENEKNIKEKFIFTDITDIYYDNIFHYYGLKYNNEQIKKIFDTEIDKQFKPRVETQETSDNEEVIEQNPFVELDDFERKLDTYISNDKVKQKQEEALNKYYELIDKDNYEKIKTLNSLAEKKELKSKLEELKFDNVIDNFGSEVFKIIDDIINLFSEKVDTFTEEKTTIDKYTSYIYRLIVILTKENRILYTGFIFIIIGFFIYFISDENKNYNLQYHNPSFLNRIF